MTSDTLLAGLVIVTILGTVALLRLYPTATRRYFFEPIENGRTAAGAFFLVIGVIYALQSGVAWMVLLAIVGIAFAVSFIYFEEPHKEIR